MKRRLFNFTAATSLLLCLGTAVLWVRSHFISESIVRFYLYPTESGTASSYRRNAGQPTFGIQQTLVATLVRGEVQLSWGWTSLNDDVFRNLKPRTFWIWRPGSPIAWENYPNSDHRFMGFRFTSGQYIVEGGAAVAIPFWAMFLFFVTLPVISVVRWAYGRTDRLTSTCDRCGYNLTGNSSGTCPECGKPIPIQGAVPSANKSGHGS